MIEVVGIIASLFIFSSLTFKCLTVKRNILMRVLNSVGSLVFVIYGVLLLLQGGFGWALVVSNSLLCGFNLYHIIRLCLTLKKKKSDLPIEPITEQSVETAETEN